MGFTQRRGLCAIGGVLGLLVEIKAFPSQPEGCRKAVAERPKRLARRRTCAVGRSLGLPVEITALSLSSQRVAQGGLPEALSVPFRRVTNLSYLRWRHGTLTTPQTRRNAWVRMARFGDRGAAPKAMIRPLLLKGVVSDPQRGAVSVLKGNLWESCRYDRTRVRIRDLQSNHCERYGNQVRKTRNSTG